MNGIVVPTVAGGIAVATGITAVVGPRFFRRVPALSLQNAQVGPASPVSAADRFRQLVVVVGEPVPIDHESQEIGLLHVADSSSSNGVVVGPETAPGIATKIERVVLPNASAEARSVDMLDVPVTSVVSGTVGSLESRAPLHDGRGSYEHDGGASNSPSVNGHVRLSLLDRIRPIFRKRRVLEEGHVASNEMEAKSVGGIVSRFLETSGSSQIAFRGSDSPEVASLPEPASASLSSVGTVSPLQPAAAPALATNVIDRYPVDARGGVGESAGREEPPAIGVHDDREEPELEEVASTDFIAVQLREVNKWQSVPIIHEEVRLTTQQIEAADQRLREFAEATIVERPLTSGLVAGWVADYADAGVDVSVDGRLAILNSMGLLDDETLAETLVRLFNGEDASPIRCCALMMIAERSLTSLSANVENSMMSVDVAERCAAVSALAALGSRQRLADLLDDAECDVVQTSAIALANLVGVDAARTAVERSQSSHRDAALDLLAFY